MNYPIEFLDYMKDLLQDEYLDYINSQNMKNYFGLRINPLKTNKEFIKANTDFILDDVPWCSEGFYYDGEKRPSKHPFYFGGLYYLQEPSAMAPVSALNVSKGDYVLDICAAPGGKSTQIGAALGGSGLLVTNDISPSRAKALTKNIELFGIKNYIALADSPSKLAERFVGFFDKILVDAPCSGEGMFRKDPDIIKAWSKARTDELLDIQTNILFACSKMLKEGGRLLYSTCTFNPLENECIISHFLKVAKDFTVIPIPKDYGFEKGITIGHKIDPQLKGAARLWPHKIKGEGHFMCLLEKKGNLSQDRIKTVYNERDKRLRSFLEFKDKYIACDFKGRYKVFKDSLFLCNEYIPDLSGIRVIKSGFHIGDFKGDRFKPSHALALGLKKSEFKNTIDLELNGSEVIKYLKGDTISVDQNGKGYYLVTTRDNPIGFGKLVDGRLKNKCNMNFRLE